MDDLVRDGEQSVSSRRLVKIYTYSSDVHILASGCCNEEVDTDSTFYHSAGELLPTWMLGLEQLPLGVDAVQIILVS